MKSSVTVKKLTFVILQVISKHRMRKAAYVGSTDPISPALGWSGFIKTTESEGTDGPTKQATAEDAKISPS